MKQQAKNLFINGPFDMRQDEVERPLESAHNFIHLSNEETMEVYCLKTQVSCIQGDTVFRIYLHARTYPSNRADLLKKDD